MASIRRPSKAGSAPTWGVLALLCLLAVGPGCVQRRLTIRSSPPGALVYIDDYEIGTTPCSTDYIYYGTRKFRLVRDGYETLVLEQRIPPPWYQYFPLDFVSENVWPGEIRDERTLNFQLVPQRISPSGEVLGRAENLRTSSRAGATSPIPLPSDSTTGAPVIPGLSPDGSRPARSQPGYLDPGFVPRGAPPTAETLPAPGAPSYALPPTGATAAPPPGGPPLYLPPGAVQAPPEGSYPPPTTGVPSTPFDSQPPGGWQPNSR